MTSKITYQGNLRTRCEHLRSGDTFLTDAPLDNNGRGEAFSPTDTVATALASCMLTMMGIKANADGMGVDLVNATVEITKHMAADPRRISKIEANLFMPANVSEKDKKILERTAHTCPVLYSLHPEIEKVITFNWVL